MRSQAVSVADALPLHMLKLLVILLFCLSFAYPAAAEIFQYFDEEGTLIVTDDPFGTKKKERQHYHQKQNRKTNVQLNYREDVSYEFYEVSGDTIHEAIASTDRVGPFDSGKGRHYAGQTRWNYGLSYNLDFSYQIDGERIRVTVQIYDIAFNSDITVILPMLAEGSRYEPHEFRAWEDFVEQLTEHEHDHVRIIREPRFRQEVVSGIAGIRELTLPYLTDEHAEAQVKGAIEAEVGNVAHGGMRKIKQKNDEYDQLTEHGRKHTLRGAFFQRL